MQKGVQTDATCNIQQCWEFLANNVASVCTKPKTATFQNSYIIRCTRVWNIVADELKLRMNALNDFKQAMAESVTKPLSVIMTVKIPALLSLSVLNVISVAVLSSPSRDAFNVVIMYFNYSYIF